MSHGGSHPPQAAMLPWDSVGRVAWSLPVVTRHWADPPLPALNERQLVAAHRHDGCTAIEIRQRAFAADPAAVEAERREIARLLRRDETEAGAA